MSENYNVVVGSAGRRLYLVDWFRDAFAALGLDGRVVVTENDPTSSAASYGDIACQLPRYSDPAYAGALLDLVEELRPRLFISANDFELMHLHVHTDLAEQMRAAGVLVPGVSARWQRDCADKLAMTELLTGLGVPTPPTVGGGNADGIEQLCGEHAELVVKHRFGSGSSGLAIVRRQDVGEAIAAAARSAPSCPLGSVSADGVVVQPRLAGVEYGVDLVAALREPGRLAAVLARRKVRMRAGETDKAVTAAPAPFQRVAAEIAEASGLTGLIDVDMFLDENDVVSVVDINPRFGGGYPFMHLAGARVPQFYLASAEGVADAGALLAYSEGVVSAKFESVRVTSVL